MNFAYLWVALGGALGSVAASGSMASSRKRSARTFPWGTLVINVTGSFVIGVIGALAIPEGRLDSQSRSFATQFLMIGVCGGYTTFSSFSLQTLEPAARPRMALRRRQRHVVRRPLPDRRLARLAARLHFQFHAPLTELEAIMQIPNDAVAAAHFHWRKRPLGAQAAL